MFLARIPGGNRLRLLMLQSLVTVFLRIDDKRRDNSGCCVLNNKEHSEVERRASK